ncbi:MAG: phosphatidylserine/phosphatidylglycerophosphate/cardiolipin synthase family protein [Oscillospiraceae bacterium]
MTLALLKKILLWVLTLAVLFLLVCCWIPPLFHKECAEPGLSPELGGSSASERVLCVDDNVDALLWRIRLIESARDELILSTFDFRGDNSGLAVMSCLMQAAERDVQVRILVNGLSGFLYLDRCDCFQALAAHPNVEVKYYNPVDLKTPWKMNYSLHDKYLVADDTVYFLGGRNTNDLFLGDYPSRQNTDRDILVYQEQQAEDSSLAALKRYFAGVWELDCSETPSYRLRESRRLQAEDSLRALYASLREEYPAAFEDVDWMDGTMPAANVTLLTNPVTPSNKEPVLWDALCSLMAGAERALVQTPYLVCSRAMYADLAALTAQGTQLSFLTNATSNGANPFGCADYLNQKNKILKTGAEIFEYAGEHSMHTKTLLLDDNISIVGSFNFDMRSTYLDTEMMLVIDCPSLNAQLRDQAAACMEQSNHVLPDGTETPGAAYQPAALSPGRSLLYGILRLATIPFRHLL